MPVHKIPAHTLHEDLAQLEREGEIPQFCVTITEDGTTKFVIVHTAFRSPRGYETPEDIANRLRRISHQSRVGADDPLLRAFVEDDIVRGDA